MIKEKLQLTIAHVIPPSLAAIGGKLGYVPVAQENEPESIQVTCEACKATLYIARKPKHADFYWCNQACYDREPYESFSPLPRYDETTKKNASAQKKVCPTCEGPAKGRGFTHTEDCAAHQTNAGPKSSCTTCGGPSHGRGFKHKADCAEKCQPYVPKSKRKEDEETIS